MTDHYAEARRQLRGLNEYQEAEGLNDFTILSVALEAQVHATLALAEQQRIANDLLREVVEHVTCTNR